MNFRKKNSQKIFKENVIKGIIPLFWGRDNPYKGGYVQINVSPHLTNSWYPCYILLGGTFRLHGTTF